MASITGILNRAFGFIGAGRVISIDDTAVRAQLARDTFDDIRQGLLQAHSWPFATFLHQLAKEQAVPPLGRAWTFRKPQANDEHAELLRTLGIFTDANTRCPAYGFIDAGQYVYADDAALYLHGIYDIVDPNRMSSLFREALAYKCASEWAVPLSNSRTRAVDAAGQCEAILLRARALADMEGAPTTFAPSSWETARFGGAGGRLMSVDPTVES